jgi:hypothetical protein
MGEDAVQNSTVSFYSLSLRREGWSRYDGICALTADALFVDEESCDRGKGTLGDRNADKNNTNHGESLVLAATET